MVMAGLPTSAPGGPEHLHRKLAVTHFADHLSGGVSAVERENPL